MPEKDIDKRALKSAYDAEYKSRKGIKEKLKQYNKEYYLANKEKIKKSSAIRYENNKNLFLSKCKDYYEKNKAVVLARKSKWKKINKSKVAFYTAKRRSIQKMAIPLWADQKKIEDFYITANALSMITGIWHHVDHIVPLQSKIVCGLHTEANLRVITAKENLTKYNRLI